MKEFLLLIRENPDYGQLSVEDMQADIQEHVEWVASLVEKGHFKDGNPLDANGVIIKSGIETDGPYVETKECVSGYYFLLAASLDEAKQLAKECPAIKSGATLELREVINTDE